MGLDVLDPFREFVADTKNRLGTCPLAPAGHGVVSGFYRESPADPVRLAGPQRQQQMQHLEIRSADGIHHRQPLGDRPTSVDESDLFCCNLPDTSFSKNETPQLDMDA